MAKKKKDEILTELEKHEIERRKAIVDFNTNNMGKYWIDPDKIPTDEDIATAKANYEKAVEALNEKNNFVIADSANSLRVANFLKTFVERTAWSGRYFIGICNFSALMGDFIGGYTESEPNELVLDYGALQFIDIILSNYGGVGIESAKWMADNWDEYVPIYDHIHGLVEEIKNEQAMCNDLKDIWAAYEQGFYLVSLESKLDEDVIKKEDIVTDDIQ